MYARILALLLVCSVVAGGAIAAPVEQKGKIESVTVYRGQALVTRVLELDGRQGPMELVVTELPARVMPESLYASGSEGVMIRAVRFRTRAVSREPREEIRKIQDQIEGVQKEMRALEASKALLAQKKTYLDRLEKFAGDKGGEDLDKGELDVDALVKLTDFLFERREELSKQQHELEEEERDLKEKLSLLQRQLAQLTTGTTRTVREAMVFLEKPAGAATLRLNYVVSGATWQPTYTVRCAGRNERIAMEYSALIQQMSGEDWNGVDLTLSTASPNMLAAAPLLTPLWVTLRPDGAQGQPMQQAEQRGQYLGQQKMNLDRLNRALQNRKQAPGGKQAQIDNDWTVNAVANEMQLLDINARAEAIRQSRMTELASAVLSVSYRLDGKISLPSRNDQQMVQIASLDLDGDFYYLSIPVLTPYVYQQADVVNTSDIALLAGSVNTYLDGQFAGSDQIPMVAKGQKFTLGFGVDSQLRVSRELAEKTEKTQGGNRKLSFTYAFRIKNYKDRAVDVRLMDRLPEAPSADIQVTLGQMSQPLSDDKLYRQTLRKSGILVWRIEVPGGASGAEAKTLEYAYSLEFDKNMAIREPSKQQVEQQKKRFREQLDAIQMGH